jgi:hypothetical protein
MGAGRLEGPLAGVRAVQPVCVIRAKSATDSDAIRPPVPTEVGHLFRTNPATYSDAFRPAIPIQSDHP